MVWAVGARYSFDCLDWPIRKVTFYHEGCLVMTAEENAAIEAAKAALGGKF